MIITNFICSLKCKATTYVIGCPIWVIFVPVFSLIHEFYQNYILYWRYFILILSGTPKLAFEAFNKLILIKLTIILTIFWNIMHLSQDMSLHLLAVYLVTQVFFTLYYQNDDIGAVYNQMLDEIITGMNFPSLI